MLTALDRLVEPAGIVKASERHGVSHRTAANCHESRHVSRKMRGVLHKHLREQGEQDQVEVDVAREEQVPTPTVHDPRDGEEAGLQEPEHDLRREVETLRTEVELLRERVEAVEGQSQRSVACEMGLARDPVRRYLATPTPERQQGRRSSPVLERVRSRLEQLLEEWSLRTTGNQRISGRRLHRQLREEGYEVGLSLVLAELREWRRRRAEVYVPLVHRPAESAQVDFFEVADPLRPSPFVNEVLEHSGADLRIVSDAVANPTEMPHCPRCEGGRLIQARCGQSLRCSLWLHCDYLAPPCSCGAGHILVGKDFLVRCTNAACRSAPEHCPKCYWGVLVERHGPYGPFWGCFHFSADPSCDFTRDRRTSTGAETSATLSAPDQTITGL